jgi:AAA+ superfamily predicted ATPase
MLFSGVLKNHFLGGNQLTLNILKMEILEQTLKKMPLHFSSNYFISCAKKKGLSQIEVNNGIVKNFLIMNAKRGDSKRLWYKKAPNVDGNDKLTEAIAFIKSKGYRVMKPVNDWIEV